MQSVVALSVYLMSSDQHLNVFYAGGLSIFMKIKCTLSVAPVKHAVVFTVRSYFPLPGFTNAVQMNELGGWQSGPSVLRHRFYRNASKA